MRVRGRITCQAADDGSSMMLQTVCTDGDAARVVEEMIRTQLLMYAGDMAMILRCCDPFECKRCAYSRVRASYVQTFSVAPVSVCLRLQPLYVQGWPRGQVTLCLLTTFR